VIIRSGSMAALGQWSQSLWGAERVVACTWRGDPWDPSTRDSGSDEEVKRQN